MNKVILLILSLIFAQASMGQAGKNFLNYSKVQIDNEDTYCTFYILKDSKKLKIKPKSDMYYTWYFKKQLNTTQGNYSGKLLSGVFEMYNYDDRLLERGDYSNGIKEGAWYTWYTSGNLKSIINWKEGKMHGVVELYTESGVLVERTQYKDGLLHGEQRIIEKDSTIVRYYKKGELSDSEPFLKKVFR